VRAGRVAAMGWVGGFGIPSVSAGWRGA
jgi:hypothetical protein